MNRSLEVLKAIYKPYRYTIKGKVTILETTSGDFIIKEKKKNLNELYTYLSSRNFYNFPNLIDASRKDVNVFEYIEEIPTPIEQKAEDIIELIASLHNKTAYFKEVSEDTFKKIYEDIKNNIKYMQTHFTTLYETYFTEIYMRPSHYLYMRNFTKIKAVLSFCEKKLDEWYEMISHETKIRVATLHNNLELSHYLKSKDEFLISWDEYKIDTPILDIVNFYKKEYEKINFEVILKKYLLLFPLLEHEKKLMIILLAMPSIPKYQSSEFNNTKEMRRLFDYIYKTEELTRPYYTKEEEKE